MASITKTYLPLLLSILLLAAGPQASGQDLQSPDWQIFLDDFGYTDLVTVTFPGLPAHEVLTGDWSGAVRYDGVPTTGGETMLLPPMFFRPDFGTNSTFQVVAPITTFHDPTNPVPGNNKGQSRIVNEDLLIDILVEMKLVSGGMAIGFNPGGVGLLSPILSSPYVMFQTYTIRNIRDSNITNLSFYQLLHTNPNNDLTGDNFGVYDPRTYAVGGFRDYHYDITTYGPSLFSPEGSDVVGFSSNTPPVGHAVGTYGAISPPEGVLGQVLQDSLSGANSAGPTDITGAMKFNLPTLGPGQTVSKTFAFWVAHWQNPPQPPVEPISLLQAYKGDSQGVDVSDMGHSGTGGDVISAVPGVFKIIPGENWRNFVAAAQMGIPYTLKNVTLVKETPSVIQCADVFPAKHVGQQGTPNIRTWWPLMYEIPGTTWALTIAYGTSQPWDDDGFGPRQPGYFHSETWRWMVDANLDSMKDVLALFHELPFGLDEVPLISDEVLYPQLIAKLDAVASALEGPMPDPLAAGQILGDFEMEVQDACIVVSPRTPRQTGPGTGIANTLENPACCKLMADAEYVGINLGVFQTVK